MTSTMRRNVVVKDSLRMSAKENVRMEKTDWSDSTVYTKNQEKFSLDLTKRQKNDANSSYKSDAQDSLSDALNSSDKSDATKIQMIV